YRWCDHLSGRKCDGFLFEYGVGAFGAVPVAATGKHGESPSDRNQTEPHKVSGLSSWQVSIACCAKPGLSRIRTPSGSAITESRPTGLPCWDRPGGTAHAYRHSFIS